jgi:formamidopyrimidine-DNA glycosylase
MPERPDLEYVIPKLDQALRGQTIRAASVHNPVVMRVAVLGKAPDLLPERQIVGVHRVAHMVHFELAGPLQLIVSPKLAGKFQLVEPKTRRRKDVAFTLDFDGLQCRYRDDVQMGQVYVVDDTAVVPGFDTVGVDVLSAEFTLAAFTRIAKKRRDQVKVFLRDKSALDSLGNAYADEVLFAAGVHPKARVRELTPEKLRDLHQAIIDVLTHARDEIARREPALDEKLRDFLKVRNRKGAPCPTCGTKIRAAGVRGHDAFFCPVCQPDNKGRGFVDWRKLKN